MSDDECTGGASCAPQKCNVAEGKCETELAPITTACLEDGGTVCDGDGSCVECNVDADCSSRNAVCVDQACAACVLGDARCDGDEAQTCDVTGSWIAEATCALGCSAGACALPYATWRMPNAPLPEATKLPFLDGVPNERQLVVTDGGLTVTDSITGLVWANEEVLPNASWTDAKAYCANLSLAGNDDWRLPTRLEGATVNGWAREGLGYDTIIATSWYSFWTASTQAANGQHWAMHDDWDGFAAYHVESDTNQAVRCVRGATTALAQRYTVRGSDNTVQDNGTKLRWTHTPSQPQPVSWSQATSICSGLSTASTAVGSWRIPTVPEMLTLIDETVAQTSVGAVPALDPGTFPKATLPPHASYWTATRWASESEYLNGNDAANAHFVDGNTGGTWYADPATGTNAVWCVHDDACAPGDKRCTGEEPELCDANGSWVVDGAACSAQSCVAGACTGDCSPGTSSCLGDVAHTCDPSGHWTDVNCALGCSVGACALPYATRTMPNAPVPNGTMLPFLGALPNKRQLSSTDGGLTVTDALTGLVWTNEEASPQAPWASAKAYCANLVLAGSDDWRLPTRLEGATVNGWAREGLGYATTIATTWYSFWTGSTEPTNGQHWAMHDDWDGFAAYQADTDTNQAIRCVRGAPRRLAQHYSVRASDDTVLDNGTGLRWTHAPSQPGAVSWSVAKATCSGLDTADTMAGSWRIPTVPELLTLVDETVPQVLEGAVPAQDPAMFPPATLPPHGVYWTATRWASPAAHLSGDDSASVHYVDGNTGGTWYSDPASGTHSVWCVHAK